MGALALSRLGSLSHRQGRLKATKSGLVPHIQTGDFFMNNPLGLRLLITTVAGVMTLSMVACNKPADSTGAAAPSITAVSYTHLDVYKRQARYPDHSGAPHAAAGKV